MSVSLSFHAIEVVSYAMAHNRIMPVRDVVMTSTDELHGAELTIEMRDDEGPISLPFSRAVDLSGGKTTRVDVPELQLDPGALLQNREARPAWVAITVRHADQVVAESRKEIRVLAGNQWQAEPLQLSMEMLAAYVLPNDPAVTTLLSEASSHLNAKTGRSALDGYQSGNPDRVDAIVGSIWQAVQERDISYAEPPASWADQGQKVRTPTEVLEKGLGTCLDTTVSLAALLEQAGIRPLLFVVPGHAFVGYWRDEAALDVIAYPDAEELKNLVDLDHIRLIETTMMTDDFDNIPFEDTQRPAVNRFVAARWSVAVDVWQARRSGIIPLPSRRVDDDGTIHVTEYKPEGPGDRRLILEHTGPRTGAALADQIPARIQQWKNSLLDLSLRNRLINYTDRAGIRLRVPDGHLPQLEDLVSAGTPLVLRAHDRIDRIDQERGIATADGLPDARVRDLLIDKQSLFVNVAEENYQSRLRQLAYKARTVQEETGANNLYLALGSLTWTLDQRELRSPLILVPVRLTTTSRGAVYRVELDESGGSTPNYCLLEKLRMTFGLQIPGLANPEEDLSGIDMDAVVAETRRAIAERGLPFHVDETADLAILQFAKFRLWKDLDEHWDEFVGNPLVKHLVETPTEPFDDPVQADDQIDLDEIDGASPMPADASQLEAVADAVAGRTFVLEGPPGTGKSQTITNLLTRAVAAGKKVLFVAEKRAALDVVSARLDAVGMGPFALDLHDKGSKPNAVRRQIRLAMRHQVLMDDEGLQANEERLVSSRRSLARYAERLHETNSLGYSYYSARTALLALGEDGPQLVLTRSVLSNRDGIAHIKSALRALPDVADLARPEPNHPWGFARGTAGTDSTVAEVRDAADRVERSLAILESADGLSVPLSACRSPHDVRVLADLARRRVRLEVLDAVRTDAWRAARTTYTQQLTAFVAASHPGLDLVTPQALDLPVEDLHGRAEAVEASGFFGRGKRRKELARELEPFLRPGAQLKPRKLIALTAALVQVRGAVRGLATQGAAVPGLEIPEAWNPLTDAGRDIVQKQVEWLEWAGAAVDGATGRPFIDAVRDWARTNPTVRDDAATALDTLARAADELGSLVGATSETWEAWSGDLGMVERWHRSSGRRRLDDVELSTLGRWVDLNVALQPLTHHGLQAAADQLRAGAIEADDAVQAFERALAQACLEERQQATGLDDFNADGHDKAVGRFSTALGEARSLMTSAIPHQVLQQRPFQASSGRGRVGELNRELNKQRGGKGVRALMHQYGDLITELMPCVLVSPDSVARFFPPGGQTFDLVVFDEASQIRVADAIGAMGRASSVVIVGDSKQMPPTSFAESSSTTDEDATTEVTTVEDEESILTEAVMARVQQKWLTWHYRSQDESLIAFSNVHYYDRKLSSFPAPSPTDARDAMPGRGVSLVRVPGTFLRSGRGKLLRTNPVEADAIFAEVKRRFDASPEVAPSLGVVTFNQQQRTYIEGLIRDSSDERMIEALDGTNGEGLFIKNLENVQGDERDVILFSTAFSAKENGVLPLNFGPLTRAGGERRLNVAITRARRQVIIFSSFDPADLRVEGTQSVGIAHLRGYMELAAYGPDSLDLTGGSETTVDRHREQIAERLREAGLVVRTDVGLSDFRVDLTLARPEDPEQPLVAVLLDGKTWAERRTVGDRDGLPPVVLGKLMHWPAVERVWMPSWLSDPDAVVARLVTTTRNATLQEPTVESAAPPTAESSELNDMPLRNASLVSSSGALEPTPLEGEQEFRPFVPMGRNGRWVLDGLPGRTEVAEVRKVITEIVEQEGPVHLERLARLVAACFDLTRLNQDRIDSIVRQVPAEMRPDKKEPFAWPTVAPGSWTWFRTEKEPARQFEHISLREIGNAMAALCRASAGMTADELTSEALSLFGWKRRTAAVTARLTEALEFAVKRRIIEAEGDVFLAR